MYKDKRVEKKKTVVMKRCLNPVFNESFAFDIPTERLRETTIVITVMDKDRLSRNDVIGKVGDTPEGPPGGDRGQPGPGRGGDPSCWQSRPEFAQKSRDGPWGARPGWIGPLWDHSRGQERWNQPRNPRAHRPQTSAVISARDPRKQRWGGEINP